MSMTDTEPELKAGDVGPAVQEVQEILSGSGWLKVDGEFGPITEALVKAFQATRGLPVDGIVGPETWKELNKAKDDSIDL